MGLSCEVRFDIPMYIYSYKLHINKKILVTVSVWYPRQRSLLPITKITPIFHEEGYPWNRPESHTWDQLAAWTTQTFNVISHTAYMSFPKLLQWQISAPPHTGASIQMIRQTRLGRCWKHIFFRQWHQGRWLLVVLNTLTRPLER